MRAAGWTFPENKMDYSQLLEKDATSFILLSTCPIWPKISLIKTTINLSLHNKSSKIHFASLLLIAKAKLSRWKPSFPLWWMLPRESPVSLSYPYLPKLAKIVKISSLLKESVLYSYFSHLLQNVQSGWKKGGRGAFSVSDLCSRW